MRPVSYGRIVFGAAAVLFGVIALMWHDADTWQSLMKIRNLPFGDIAGECLMFAQIAGGLGIQLRPTARSSSVVLGVVYAAFTLACIPDIAATPNAYLPYGDFFYQLSTLCGASAVYAAAEPNATRAAAFARAARLGIGLCAISFTLSQIFYFQLTAGLVPTWIPPNQNFWAILTTVAFALAAIAILTGRRAGLALRLLTLMLALFGILVWVPRLIAQPHVHGNWSEFTANFLMTGAVWLVAELKT